MPPTDRRRSAARCSRTIRRRFSPSPTSRTFPSGNGRGFTRPHTDYHLRCHGIKTLIAVGFSQRSCLYFTCAGAVEHNYRVVMLRDCTHSAEYPDTVDDSLPEGGWLRKIMLRNFEHVVGYTSTSAEFVQACSALTEAQP